MDMHNALLHEDLEEKVFMKMPPGFRSSDPRKVCKLHKSLYRLCQALRQCFSKLSSKLLEYGFVQSYADYSLFTYHKEGKYIALLVYIDDIVPIGNDP